MDVLSPEGISGALRQYVQQRPGSIPVALIFIDRDAQYTALERHARDAYPEHTAPRPFGFVWNRLNVRHGRDAASAAEGAFAPTAEGVWVLFSDNRVAQLDQSAGSDPTAHRAERQERAADEPAEAAAGDALPIPEPIPLDEAAQSPDQPVTERRGKRS